MKIEEERIILPPFTMESAVKIVQISENYWNAKDPEKVCSACTIDSDWRDRTEFINGQEEIKHFLIKKWKKELDFKLVKKLWGFRNNRMAISFECEWHNCNGQWYHSYGNELLEFDGNGLIVKRNASINDLPIAEAERKLI